MANNQNHAEANRKERDKDPNAGTDKFANQPLDNNEEAQNVDDERTQHLESDELDQARNKATEGQRQNRDV
jgi:hypothetical protein